MNPPILKLSNLTIGYKTQKAKIVVAKNIHLEFQKSKLIALVGANGIGKSTLLKTIIGFEKPLGGTIFLNQKDLATITPDKLAKHISIVLTEKLPSSNLSVYQLIALGRQPYTNWIGRLSDLDKQIIDKVIQLTEIEEFVHKKHYQLSDGQHQKVMIARSLAQDTEILILDEPTTHLDLLHKISILKLLKKLSQEIEKCILFSTHEIDLAIEFCDEIIVMTTDKTQKDTPENLIQNSVFDSLFTNETIVFDKEKRKFSLVQTIVD